MHLFCRRCPHRMLFSCRITVYGCVEWTSESDRVPAPLAVSIALPFVQPSVGCRNSPPPLSTVTLPQLLMLFQCTYGDRHTAEAPAEPRERIVKSPLQRTLTAHIMSRWAKHEGALAHISLQRSVEMLSLQCAQRFPARPADPDSSVFAELFLTLSLKPRLRRRLSRCTSTGTLLVFCRTFLSKSL